MHGEDLLVNDGCDGKTIEAVCKSFPQLDVISSLTLVIKAIDAINGRAFVIAAENEEVFWVLDLVCKQQADGFE